MTTDWQPIETAPKDGTRILVCDKWEGVVVSWWGSDCGFKGDPKQWLFGTSHQDSDDTVPYYSEAAHLTHWMPLPEPPE